MVQQAGMRVDVWPLARARLTQGVTCSRRCVARPLDIKVTESRFGAMCLPVLPSLTALHALLKMWRHYWSVMT